MISTHARLLKKSYLAVYTSSRIAVICDASADNGSQFLVVARCSLLSQSPSWLPGTQEPAFLKPGSADCPSVPSCSGELRAGALALEVDRYWTFAFVANLCPCARKSLRNMLRSIASASTKTGVFNDLLSILGLGFIDSCHCC